MAEVGDEDVAVSGVVLDMIDRLGDRRRTADERRAGGHLDDQLADGQALALGELAPLGGDGERVGLVADAAAGDRRAAVDIGVDVGQWAVGVVSREVVAHLLDEGDTCGLTCCRRMWAASSSASASVSATTAVAAGMILRSSRRRPYRASRCLTSV